MRYSDRETLEQSFDDYVQEQLGNSVRVHADSPDGTIYVGKGEIIDVKCDREFTRAYFDVQMDDGTIMYGLDYNEVDAS